MTKTRPPSDDSIFFDYRPTRRALFPLAGAAALAAIAPSTLASAHDLVTADAAADSPIPGAQPRFVYVGTYTKPNTAPGGVMPSEALGLYVFTMNPATGALTLVEVVQDLPDQPLPNPSWLDLNPQLTHLYATSEVSTWNGLSNNGGATAFAIDPTNGKLTRLNDQPSEGAIPASVTVDPTGRYALIANYVGATFTLLPIEANGTLGPATDVFLASGTGPDRARQDAPHPHDVKLDPAGRFAFGPDLGTDKVWAWTLDLSNGKLVPVPLPDPPYGQVASGSGPRHMSFHPSGKWAYVIDEMVSSITAFKYGATHGTFIWNQTVSTLPPDFTGTNSAAEIMIHPSGMFVYGSNRGHNSIVGFAIDQTSGQLSPISWTSTQGSWPRSFGIDPSGSLLLAANQNSNTIVPFRISQENGKLKPTEHVTSTPTPVRIAFGSIVPT